VTTGSAALIRWYAGQRPPRDAGRGTAMRVAAPPWLERELVRWGRLNPYAGIGPARLDPHGMQAGAGLAAAAAAAGHR